MDALTGIVWEDDSQIEDAVVHRRYDKRSRGLRWILKAYDPSFITELSS
jgi:Holliday junction resolvase RusA-like endonuclease